MGEDRAGRYKEGLTLKRRGLQRRKMMRKGIPVVRCDQEDHQEDHQEDQSILIHRVAGPIPKGYLE